MTHLLFVDVVEIATEMARAGVLADILYAVDLVLTVETVEGYRDMFTRLKDAFRSKALNVYLTKTKLIVKGQVVYK